MATKKKAGPAPANNFIYDAVVVDVTDGDTVKVNIDLGLDTWKHGAKLRLNGINTPEKDTEAGQAAKAYVASVLKPGEVVRIETVLDRTEKYGRFLATIYHPSLPVSVNDDLISKGYAKPYDGRGVKPV